MPTLTFTTEWVKWVKPPETGQVDYFDTWKPIERGVSFVLRVSYGGTKVWHLIYRDGGRWRRHKLGNYPALRLSDARDEASRMALDIADRRETTRRERKVDRQPSFAALAADYLEQHAREHKRSWVRDRQILDRELLPYFGERAFNSVSRWDVVDRLQQIAADRPVWANRTLEVVRGMYNWSRNQRKYRALEYNPFSGILRPGVERARTRVLSPDEIAQVWEVYERMGRVGVAFKLQLITAQRSGMVLRMRSEEIDGRWWTAQGPPGGRSHRVYLTDLALEEIGALSATGGWLFPSPSGHGPMRHLGKAHERVRESSGVDFRADDLRRTACDGMGRCGISDTIVALTSGRRVADFDHDAVNMRDRLVRHALELWEKTLRRTVPEQTAPLPVLIAGGVRR